MGRMSRLYSIFVWAKAGCPTKTTNNVAINCERLMVASSTRMVIQPARLRAAAGFRRCASVARRRRRDLRQRPRPVLHAGANVPGHGAGRAALVAGLERFD